MKNLSKIQTQIQIQKLINLSRRLKLSVPKCLSSKDLFSPFFRKTKKIKKGKETIVDIKNHQKDFGINHYKIKYLSKFKVDIEYRKERDYYYMSLDFSTFTDGDMNKIIDSFHLYSNDSEILESLQEESKNIINFPFILLKRKEIVINIRDKFNSLIELNNTEFIK